MSQSINTLMKECSSCHQQREEADFAERKGKLQSYCIECNRLYQKQYYKDNKDKALARKEWHRQQHRLKWDEFKKTLKCSRCPENHPACLDFHHLDPNEKEFNLASAFVSHGVKKTMKELEKCIVLCSNCHRKLHYEEDK